MEIATGNLAKSLNEIPEQIIQTYFCCNISALKNKSRNTSPLILDGLFAPHAPCYPPEEIYIEYVETVVCSFGFIATSDGLVY